METLKLELSGYLHHKLIWGCKGYAYFEMYGYNPDEGWLLRPLNYPERVQSEKTMPMLKPIFHPLSDLTKPIQHNGAEFVPEYKMWEASENKDFIIKLAPSGAVHNETPYWAFQKLIEWRFNVFNLPSHLWIDVNTLEENPYK